MSDIIHKTAAEPDSVDIPNMVGEFLGFGNDQQTTLDYDVVPTGNQVDYQGHTGPWAPWINAAEGTWLYTPLKLLSYVFLPESFTNGRQVGPGANRNGMTFTDADKQNRYKAITTTWDPDNSAPFEDSGKYKYLLLYFRTIAPDSVLLAGNLYYNKWLETNKGGTPELYRQYLVKNNGLNGKDVAGWLTSTAAYYLDPLKVRSSVDVALNAFKDWAHHTVEYHQGWDTKQNLPEDIRAQSLLLKHGLLGLQTMALYGVNGKLGGSLSGWNPTQAMLVGWQLLKNNGYNFTAMDNDPWDLKLSNGQSLKQQTAQVLQDLAPVRSLGKSWTPQSALNYLSKIYQDDPLQWDPKLRSKRIISMVSAVQSSKAQPIDVANVMNQMGAWYDQLEATFNNHQRFAARNAAIPIIHALSLKGNLPYGANSQDYMNWMMHTGANMAASRQHKHYAQGKAIAMGNGMSAQLYMNRVIAGGGDDRAILNAAGVDDLYQLSTQALASPKYTAALRDSSDTMLVASHYRAKVGLRDTANALMRLGGSPENIQRVSNAINASLADPNNTLINELLNGGPAQYTNIAKKYGLDTGTLISFMNLNSGKPNNMLSRLAMYSSLRQANRNNLENMRAYEANRARENQGQATALSDLFQKRGSYITLPDTLNKTLYKLDKIASILLNIVRNTDRNK